MSTRATDQSKAKPITSIIANSVTNASVTNTGSNKWNDANRIIVNNATNTFNAGDTFIDAFDTVNVVTKLIAIARSSLASPKRAIDANLENYGNRRFGSSAKLRIFNTDWFYNACSTTNTSIAFGAFSP
ncbi:MAG: hypothetical protein Q9174_004505 [Haloplaca sp. 1 TL-2023]